MTKCHLTPSSLLPTKMLIIKDLQMVSTPFHICLFLDQFIVGSSSIFVFFYFPEFYWIFELQLKVQIPLVFYSIVFIVFSEISILICGHYLDSTQGLYASTNYIGFKFTLSREPCDILSPVARCLDNARANI